MATTKDKFKSNEERVYNLLKQQEQMAEKWRTEHHNSIKYFEKIIVDLNSQIKMLKKENATFTQGAGKMATMAQAKDASAKF